jgi:hypothetical protein
MNNTIMICGYTMNALLEARKSNSDMFPSKLFVEGKAHV